MGRFCDFVPLNLFQSVDALAIGICRVHKMHAKKCYESNLHTDGYGLLYLKTGTLQSDIGSSRSFLQLAFKLYLIRGTESIMERLAFKLTYPGTG